MSRFRSAGGGRIDRSRGINFTFDGRLYTGLQGDTLAFWCWSERPIRADALPMLVSVQLFSALKREGLEELRETLSHVVEG